jgi:hypothetical protein
MVCAIVLALISASTPVQDALVARTIPTTRQINLRLPVASADRLAAATYVLGEQPSRIVANALDAYFAAMPPARRKAIDEASALRKRQP